MQHAVLLTIKHFLRSYSPLLSIAGMLHRNNCLTARSQICRDFQNLPLFMKRGSTQPPQYTSSRYYLFHSIHHGPISHCLGSCVLPHRRYTPRGRAEGMGSGTAADGDRWSGDDLRGEVPWGTSDAHGLSCSGVCVVCGCNSGVESRMRLRDWRY
jgi:hypothetical protein